MEHCFSMIIVELLRGVKELVGLFLEVEEDTTEPGFLQYTSTAVLRSSSYYSMV